MGRIDTLVIENFKSYNGKHTLGPFYNFTCIIGPNGSGKSNIMDSISFVLGIRSTQLRSVNMSELIYKRGNITAATSCSVELNYQHDDNSITAFKRRIDTKGVSTYSINGKSMRWEQYNSALEDIGILVKVKNFLVYQGDVAETANKSPQQFTELFEQISGSAALRDDYNKAKQHAEEIEEQFIRIFERKKIIQKEKKVIKQQKDEAERYTELIQENKQLKREFALTQLYYSDIDISAKQDEVTNNNEQIATHRERLDAIDTQITDVQSEIAKNKLDSTNTEKKSTTIQNKIDKLKPDQIKVKQSIEHIEKSIHKQQQALSKLQHERIEHSKTIQSLQQELNNVQKQQSELDELLASEQGREFVIAENKLAEYNQLKLQAGKQLAVLTQELESVKRLYKTDADRAQQLQKSIDNLRRQHSNVTNELHKYQEDIERYTNSLNDKKSLLEAKRKQLAELKQQHERNSKRIDEVRHELVSIQQYIASGDSIKSESKQQLRMNEAIDSLKLHLTGVHGRITNLITPIQSKYKIAIAVALGKHTNSIVVDDQKTAIECIKYLKEQRIGVATFIPIDTIKTTTINESLRNIGGTAKLAYDCVEFDNMYERAIAYALSNTLIVDTEQEAKSLAYGSQQVRNRGKIVVLNGTILHKNNNITGGDKKSITRISDYDDKLYQQKQVQLSELRTELYKLDAALSEQRLIHQLELECTDLQQSIQQIQPTIQHCESTLKSKHIQLDDITDAINEKTAELERLQDSIDKHQTTIDHIQQQIYEQENTIFAEFSRSVGVNNIREYEETHMKLIQQQTDKKLQLQSTAQRLQQQLQQLQSKDVQSGIDKLHDIIAANEQKLKELKKQEKSITVEMTQYAVEMDGINQYLEKLHHTSLELNQALKSLKHQHSTVQREIDSVEKLNIVLYGAIKQLRVVRGELVRRCRLEQIELPIVESTERRKSSAEKKKRKSKKSREEMEIDGEEEDDEFLASVEDEANVELDYSDLTENLEARTPAQRDRVRAEYEHRISENAIELERLAPNLKAYEKLDEMSDKLTTAQHGYERVAKEHHNAQSAFDNIRQKRIELFLDAYEHISHDIEIIYSQLTKSPEFPTGGRAYLQLESMDEPFSAGIKYTAMPPMKRFRPMDQLSGGEKSIAALALVFAIHQYKPAPFFVLDEVDAALDIPNVQRLSAYIRHRSHEAVSPLQCVVISLKETLYTKSDALIGVCRDQPNHSSAVLHLDLTKYERSQI